MERHEAITQSYLSISNKIIVPVSVTNDKGESKVFPGLIDTGATNTNVSRELAPYFANRWHSDEFERDLQSKIVWEEKFIDVLESL